MINPEAIAFVIVGAFGLWLILILSMIVKGSIRNWIEYRRKIDEARAKRK